MMRLEPMNDHHFVTDTWPEDNILGCEPAAALVKKGDLARARL